MIKTVYIQKHHKLNYEYLRALKETHIFILLRHHLYCAVMSIISHHILAVARYVFRGIHPLFINRRMKKIQGALQDHIVQPVKSHSKFKSAASPNSATSAIEAQQVQEKQHILKAQQVQIVQQV
jgi:hypothetical protein